MQVFVERRETLRFDHDWLRERMRATLSDDDMRSYHGRIAAALARLKSADWSERMRHEAGAGNQDRALEAALNAAEAAWAGCRLPAMAQALAIADNLVESRPIDHVADRRWHLLRLRESYLSLAERGSAWSGVLEQMLAFAEQAGRADWQIIALIRHGRALREQGRLHAAEGPLYRAATLAHAHVLPEPETRARISLAAVLEDRGDVEQALIQEERAVAAAEASGDATLRLHAQGVLAYMQMRAGLIDEANALNTSVLADPDLERSPLLQARFTRHHGIIHIAARRYATGIALLRDSVRRSQGIGDTFGLLTCQASLAWYLALLGQTTESDILAEATREQAQRLHAQAHLAWLALAQAWNARSRNESELARSLAAEAAELGMAAGDPEVLAAASGLVATCALEAGQPQSAQRAIERARRAIRAVSHPSIITAHIAARVAHANGQHEQARSLAHSAVAAAERTGLSAIYASQVLWEAAQVLAKVEGRYAAEAIQSRTFIRFLHDLSGFTVAAERRAFIAANNAHRAIARLQPCAGKQLTLLPAYDAPTGRPLHPDELTPVIWTLPAAADGQDVASRRHRLRQLVLQAQAQGASPTVEALAHALAVAPRTVQRDLHILRKAGDELETRGSSKPHSDATETPPT
jgi:hypothetical protein